MTDFSPDYDGFLVTADGLSLFTQGWQPSGPPRAAVVIVHGLAEHSGRYGHLALPLTERGLAVLTYDQRGHGRSDGPSTFTPSFDHYLDDLGLFMTSVRTRHPGVPLFLFGHSMGGAVAALYVLERDDDLRGLILSSPALALPNSPPALLQGPAALLGRLLPHLPTLAIDRALVSRDPVVVEEAREDPLNYHGRVPARTGTEIVAATGRIERQMEKLTLPLLLFHGTADALTLPEGTQRLYDRARSEDKTLHLYDGFYHETFNEPAPDRRRVLADLQSWIIDRVER